jgi:hypothetical protein
MKTQIELYSNIFRHLSLIAIAACACAVAPTLLAQSDLPPTPPGMAEYYSAPARSGSDSPGGVHAEEDSGPPGSFGGTGGGGGVPEGGGVPLPDYGTNLCLTITLASNQETVTISLSNTVSNVNYLLLVTTNLATGTWVTNQSLLATSTVTVAAPFWTYDYPGLFFKAIEAPAPTPGSVKWKTFLSTSGFDGFEGTGLDSSPAVSSATGQILVTIANNTVFTNCLLFAVDPIFGQVQWADNIFTNYNTEISYQPGEMTGSAAISSDGTIYVGGLDGYLYSINPDGTTNWQRHTGNINSVYSTPAIGSNGLIYVASDEAEEGHGPTNTLTGVTAFYTNGSTNFFFQPQDLFYGNFGDVDSCPIAGADGSIYFVGEGSRLYALTADAQLKWFLPLPGDAEPDSTPALAPNGTIVVGSGNINVSTSPYVYDVNPDGSLNWIFNVASFGGGTIIQSAPTIDQNGVIYVGSATLFQDQTGCVFAINPDGSPKWIFTNQVGYTISAPAVAADGTVYVGDEGGLLYAITNGVPRWTFTNTTFEAFIGSPAILPDGSVLIASEDGNLYCLWGTAPVDENSAWPLFQQSLDHNAQQPPTDFTNTVPYCGAPFVFNGFYTGDEFGFSMTGTPGSSNWNVYAITNLTNTSWSLLASNLTMNATNGNNSFTESDVSEYSQRFYKVSRSNCCSQAIGFVNLTVANKTNLIADQLYQVDDNVLFAEFDNGTNNIYPMNTLNSLFAISNAWGIDQAGTQIFKWNGVGFDGTTNDGFTSPTWFGPGAMTLLPGTGVLMNNVTGTSFTTAFVGLIREQQIFQIPQATNHLSPTTNYLSATIPEAGLITNITSYMPTNGDTIQLWNSASNKFVSYAYTSNSWGTNGVPALSVGEGFVLITTNAHAWTNTWEVCPDP